jgi:hypothetical protein
VTHGHEDLGISLILSRRAELDVAETLKLIKSNHIKFLVSLSKKMRPNKPKFLYHSQVCEGLVQLISSPTYILAALYLISKIPAKSLSLQNLAHISRTLRSLLSFHRDNTIIEHWNPMLVSVACTNLCIKVAKYQWEFKHSFELMQVKFKTLACSYISKFTEFRKVFLIYTDPSYPGGTLLDLMTARSAEYRHMLESNLVTAVVEHLWSGNAKRVMMHRASPLYQAYTNKNADKVFTTHNSDKMQRRVNCSFSFSAWKRSAEMRFWLDTLYLMVVLIRVVISIRIFAESNLIIYNWAEIPQDRIDAGDDLKAERQVLWICLAYFIVVQLRILYEWGFQFINGQKIRFSKRNIVDFALFVFMLAAVEKVQNRPEEIRTIEDWFAIILILVCMKGCMIMLITKQLGPVVRSIGIIIISASKYILLFLLSVLSFSLCFYVLFYRQSERFDTIGGSFTVLFDFSAGNLDFDSFGDRKDLGIALTVLFTFVSIVLLLNIIVAFITNRYSSMEPQANADYASLLYNSYKVTRYNEQYSALVMYPVPTNLIIIALSPLYLLIKNVSKFNRVMMAISYVQMLLLALTLFTIYNVILIPVVYLRTAGQLIRATLQNRKYARKTVVWIVIGVFYEVFLCVISYRYVVPVLVESTIQPDVYELSREMLEETLKLAERFTKDREAPVIVPLNELLEALSEKAEEKDFLYFVRNIGHSLKKASLYHNVIKNFHLCNQVEFIEQFLWYDRDDDQQVNLTLLTKMVQELAYNSSLLIPVNVSGIQRALLKFKKKRH